MTYRRLAMLLLRILAFSLLLTFVAPDPFYQAPYSSPPSPPPDEYSPLPVLPPDSSPPNPPTDAPPPDQSLPLDPPTADLPSEYSPPHQPAASPSPTHSLSPTPIDYPRHQDLTSYAPPPVGVTTANGSRSSMPAGTIVGIVLGAIGAVVLLIILVIVLWWMCYGGRQAIQQPGANSNNHNAGCFMFNLLIRKITNNLSPDNKHGEGGFSPIYNIGQFTLSQLREATNNFSSDNKLGEGGFGPVYKGRLWNGTIVAIKKLSSNSNQGNREFVNEIGMISALQHPHLVKLYGCCTEEQQLLLVYEYMENNSLAGALYGLEAQKLHLDWPTRKKICIGIARGLAYLHGESILEVVHRDIKTANVLLDKNLNPKISDFGLAKLHNKSHTLASIAGTPGYMAPEYASEGYLTKKTDVYSFGVVLFEIVSGRKNIDEKRGFYLLKWAKSLEKKGSHLQLVDPRLGPEFDKNEIMIVINLAMLCTSTDCAKRPTMSEVVSVLEGKIGFEDFVSKPIFNGRDDNGDNGQLN